MSNNEIPMALEVNGLTGEISERKLTSDEIAEINLIQSERESRKAEQEAKESARESALAKLAALGLTEAEIAAL
jgi:hypothetical protein